MGKVEKIDTAQSCTVQRPKHCKLLNGYTKTYTRSYGVDGTQKENIGVLHIRLFEKGGHNFFIFFLRPYVKKGNPGYFRS